MFILGPPVIKIGSNSQSTPNLYDITCSQPFQVYYLTSIKTLSKDAFILLSVEYDVIF